MEGWWAGRKPVPGESTPRWWLCCVGLLQQILQNKKGIGQRPGIARENASDSNSLMLKVSDWFLVTPSAAPQFLSRQKCSLYISGLMDLFLAGRDQSAAHQPNNRLIGLPPFWPLDMMAEAWVWELLFNLMHFTRERAGHVKRVTQEWALRWNSNRIEEQQQDVDLRW
jgi:hypothetical protein